MWYHKTRLGTLWIVESEEDHQYYLGMDEESLGTYKKIEDAMRDIREHETGFLKWDLDSKTQAPDQLEQWQEGEPENWSKF